MERALSSRAPTRALGAWRSLARRRRTRSLCSWMAAATPQSSPLPLSRMLRTASAEALVRAPRARRTSPSQRSRGPPPPKSPSSAISKEEAASTVGLRLPSMSTSYVFAYATTCPKRALEPLTTTRVPLKILGCWLILQHGKIATD